MAYNNQLSRVDIQPLLPEDVLSSFLNDLQDTSVALTAFRKVPVAQAQTRIPILSALPRGTWSLATLAKADDRDGATSTSMSKRSPDRPDPRDVLDDLADAPGRARTSAPIQPTIVAEMARVIDQAVFLINAPASSSPSVLAFANACCPHQRAHRTARIAARHPRRH